MQTNKPRLIDANALNEAMKILKFQINDGLYSDWEKACDKAIALLQSAPTVETTDDVLARLPEGTHIRRLDHELFVEKYRAMNDKSLTKAYGDTPLEAVKKLEASLNRK